MPALVIVFLAARVCPAHQERQACRDQDQRYDKARREDAAIEDLPWLALGPYEGNRIELFDQAQTRRAFTVRPTLASDNIFAIYEAAKRGLGLAILPRWFVASDLEASTLIDAASNWRAASLPVNLAIAAGTKRPARVEQFCEALQTWASDHLSQDA